MAVIDIQSAIEDLKLELDGGTEVSKAVEYTAKEYGAKPEVLVIRFERQYGCSPENYQPPVDRSKEFLANAVKEQAARWMLNDVSKKLLGTRFFAQGEWWLFVAYDGSKIYAVRETNGDPMKIWGSKTVRETMLQLNKKLEG